LRPPQRRHHRWRGLRILFFTTSTSATCRCQFADVPAGSDVADFRCPMCTSAEPYAKYNGLPHGAAIKKCNIANIITLCQCKRLDDFSNKFVTGACRRANKTLLQSPCNHAAVPELTIWIKAAHVVCYTDYSTSSQLLNRISTQYLDSKTPRNVCPLEQ